ncbi:ALK and LTK ligand 1 [Gastrophryne carolinensis]
MLRASKWQAVLAISALLLTVSVQGVSDRKTLLELIGRIAGDSGGGSRESGRVTGSRQHSTERGAPRLTSGERAAPAPRNYRRPSDRRGLLPFWSSSTHQTTQFFSRDSTLKEKFINHFTAGPILFSAECSKQFYRIYHNTKDCSTPADYKRCARLLTNLAKKRYCSQP